MFQLIARRDELKIAEIFLKIRKEEADEEADEFVKHSHLSLAATAAAH